MKTERVDASVLSHKQTENANTHHVLINWSRISTDSLKDPLRLRIQLMPKLKKLMMPELQLKQLFMNVNKVPKHGAEPTETAKVNLFVTMPTSENSYRMHTLFVNLAIASVREINWPKERRRERKDTNKKLALS